jgi:dUTP pyrophosphatase
MAIKFEKVKRFADADFNLPVRKTKNSAGYDFEVAEDICIPTWTSQLMALVKGTPQPKEPYSLDELAALTKQTKAKPTLVSTGVKCHLDEGYYLELSVRSSTPLKYWIILANSVGIIDADYCDNPDNEGEIFFQVINMSPFDIYLKKGDIIGQGIIKQYEVTDDDKAEGLRTGGFGSTTDPGIQFLMDLFDAAAATSVPARGMRATAGIYDEAIDTEAKGVVEQALKEELNKSLFDACM